MANPQCENGFTKIANEIIDELVKTPLLGAELQICLFVIRKTYGFGKKEDAISITQFEQATNKTRPTIVKALKNLQLVNILKLVKVGDSKISSNIYMLNKDYDTWKLVKTPKPVKFSYSTSKANGKKLVKGSKHTKETTKERTKESQFILPDYIPEETWNAYLEVRNKKRAAKTTYALNLIIKELEKYKPHQLENLNQSIKNGWTDIYPLKETGNGNKQTFKTDRGERAQPKEYEPEPFIPPSDEEIKRTLKKVHEMQNKTIGGN